jgi:hypothetical protein
MSELEIDEDLRQLSWKVLISRDRLLRIAEKLPAQTRERAQHTADRLMTLCANLRNIIENIPAGVALPERISQNMAGLRLSIELALEELGVLIKDLHDILGEDEDGGAGPQIN